jgi:hypothetical protein
VSQERKIKERKNMKSKGGEVEKAERKKAENLNRSYISA